MSNGLNWDKDELAKKLHDNDDFLKANLLTARDWAKKLHDNIDYFGEGEENNVNEYQPGLIVSIDANPPPDAPKSSRKGTTPQKGIEHRKEHKYHVSERQFQRLVIELAKLTGWKVCHFRPARVLIKGVETWRTPVEGDKGCPDTILARKKVVLLWELKTEIGKVTPEEQEWLDASGGEVMRPQDWDRIVETLK